MLLQLCACSSHHAPGMAEIVWYGQTINVAELHEPQRAKIVHHLVDTEEEAKDTEEEAKLGGRIQYRGQFASLPCTINGKDCSLSSSLKLRSGRAIFAGATAGSGLSQVLEIAASHSDMCIVALALHRPPNMEQERLCGGSQRAELGSASIVLRREELGCAGSPLARSRPRAAESGAKAGGECPGRTKACSLPIHSVTQEPAVQHGHD